jgi:hypothetical protein
MVAVAAQETLRGISAGEVVLERVDHVVRERRRVGALGVTEEGGEVLADDAVKDRVVGPARDVLGGGAEQRSGRHAERTARGVPPGARPCSPREFSCGGWWRGGGAMAKVGARHPWPAELSDVRGHVNLVQEAKTRREVLLERLRGAQGGPVLLTELQVLRDASDAAFADAYLDLWITVRDWLRRRLPAQVAEVDDPREALVRLRDQLSGLEERLARQESDLRGASEDVARGIDVQIRKARGQVTRLNKNLEGVAFGSIQGIRVRLQQVERMEQVLRALREGAAQGLLFQADMPIEEALDEIFRRYGGGRTGGQRLLDYREYVHLQVEAPHAASARPSTWRPSSSASTRGSPARRTSTRSA